VVGLELHTEREGAVSGGFTCALAL
jgi:hypothetical protein